MGPQRPTPRNLQAALLYAAQGRPVFPVKPNKTPYTTHGFLDATRDEKTIRNLWDKWPDANVAIATGPASGIVVLDVDPSSGGEASLARLQESGNRLPETLTVRTPRGGVHYHFLSGPNQIVRCSSGKLGPGLDVRGDGGYVVMPPSRGENGCHYDWGPLVDLAPLPAWFVKLLSDRAERDGPSSGADAPAKIPKGQRNTMLASLGGTMRKRGMSFEAILAALLEENRQRCQPPLPENEVRQIVASVSRYPPRPNKRAPASKASLPSQDEPDFKFYRVENGRVVFLKNTSHGLTPVTLSNFNARIVEEIVLDDGRDTSRAFQVEGTLANGDRLPSIRVPAEKFSSLNWVTERWGARAVIAATQGARDRLREGIQRLSWSCPHRHRPPEGIVHGRV